MLRAAFSSPINKDVLKNRYILNYFMSGASSSPVKFITKTITFSIVNWVAESKEICCVLQLTLFYLKFYGERNTGLCAITAASYKQPNNF